jgi:hypothetical protein
MEVVTFLTEDVF